MKIRDNLNTIEGIDLLRGIAIILMVITHATRLLLTQIEKPDLSFFFKFFLDIEPFTSSLFLFLVGVGLYYSNKSTKLNYKQWILKNLKKSLILYSIGVTFFLAEYQVFTLDTFLSPSILSVIALAVMSHSLVIRSPLWIKITFLVSILGTYYLFSQETISGFTAGPGGAFPLIGFTSLGIIVSEIKEKKSKLLIGLLALSLGFWIIDLPFTQSFISDYGSLKVSFWNHSLAGFLKLIPCLTTSFLLCFNLKNKFLSTLGRHSLFCYVFHLTILAILFQIGLIPTTTFSLAGLIFALILSCFLIKKN